MLPVSARYFDGQGAGRRDVRTMLSEDGRALLIMGGGLPALEWPLDDLRALPGRAQAGRMTLALHDASAAGPLPLGAARLELGDADLIARLRARCPGLARRDRRPGLWRRLAGRGALSAGAVVLVLFVILPRMADTLAGLIPVEREIAFGRAVTAQIERALGAGGMGDLDCTAPEGLAALGRMRQRLEAAGDLDYALDVVVLDHPMINAFAAPGGQIVLMRGLIEQATSADAVAAVLAHEIGHVEARDATRLALRAAGSAGLLSMVMGDVTGGAAAVFLGERVIQASYTREAEAAADRFALDLLAGAGVSSTDMAQFFQDISALQGGAMALPSYLSSHPASDARAARAQAHAGGQGATTPILDAPDWQALRAICE